MKNPRFIKEKDAKKEMEKIGAEKAGIEYMLDKSKFRIIKLFGVRNAIANILKQEMLSIGGEAAVNKGCVNCTVEKTDVLMMGTIRQFKKLIRKMKMNVSDSGKVGIQLEKILKK